MHVLCLFPYTGPSVEGGAEEEKGCVGQGIVQCPPLQLQTLPGLTGRTVLYMAVEDGIASTLLGPCC